MTTTRTPIALIGGGAISKFHIKRIQDSSNLALAGIADPSDAARAYAAELGTPWFADHRALLDAVKPQGAIVATPNLLHTPCAVDCLERGVAALVEKPIAHTLESARELVAAQQRTGVPVLVGHHRRHNPINQRAKAIVASGRLGKIVSVTALAFMFKPEPYFNLAWRKSAGGGPILINLIHDIDMMRYLVGDIASVQAFDSHEVRQFEVEETAAAVMRFANGALGTVTVSDTAAAPWNWDYSSAEQDQYVRQDQPAHFIVGTHGSLTLPDLRLWHYTGERSWHAALSEEKTFVHKQDPYSLQLQHFKAVMDGSAEPLCSALDGLGTLAATLAVHEAAVTCQTQQVPG
jgi:predicted dehydrogenase